MKYKLSPYVLIEPMDSDEYILFNAALGTFAGVNSTAKAIIDVITDQPRTVEDIVAELLKTYEVEREALLEDVGRCVTSMVEKGFVDEL